MKKADRTEKDINEVLLNFEIEQIRSQLFQLGFYGEDHGDESQRVILNYEIEQLERRLKTLRIVMRKKNISEEQIVTFNIYDEAGELKDTSDDGGAK
jgi:hypothetical protein